MDSIVPFFCGDSEECRTLGSKKALETAKSNIRSKVGEEGGFQIFAKIQSK